MFCVKCGAQLNDEARFCTNCGTVTETAATGQGASAPQPAQQPVFQQTAPPRPPQYAPPPYVMPAPQPAQPQYAAPPYAPPKKKRRTGCLVVLIILLVIMGAGLLIFAKFAWLPPRDLGIRYTQADFDSAVNKIGLKVDFNGMDSDELTGYIDDHAGEKLPLDDFNWEFSDYEERSFELTPAEVTAFANEIAPLLSWFDNVQIKGNSDGSSAGSYKVHFDKIKDELIPDVVDQIPPAIANLLPDTFNLYLAGSFAIKENEIAVPDKLDQLDVGLIPMQPVIGDLAENDRATVFDYVERLYKQIDGLVIHSLEVNSEGNFAVAAYMPTKVTVTDKN